MVRAKKNPAEEEKFNAMARQEMNEETRAKAIAEEEEKNMQDNAPEEVEDAEQELQAQASEEANATPQVEHEQSASTNDDQPAAVEMNLMNAGSAEGAESPVNVMEENNANFKANDFSPTVYDNSEFMAGVDENEFDNEVTYSSEGDALPTESRDIQPARTI